MASRRVVQPYGLHGFDHDGDGGARPARPAAARAARRRPHPRSGAEAAASPTDLRRHELNASTPCGGTPSTAPLQRACEVRPVGPRTGQASPESDVRACGFGSYRCCRAASGHRPHADGEGHRRPRCRRGDGLALHVPRQLPCPPWRLKPPSAPLGRPAEPGPHVRAGHPPRRPRAPRGTAHPTAEPRTRPWGSHLRVHRVRDRPFPSLGVRRCPDAQSGQWPACLAQRMLWRADLSDLARIGTPWCATLGYGSPATAVPKAPSVLRNDSPAHSSGRPTPACRDPPE